MSPFFETLQNFFTAIGIPGMLVLTFIDSAGMPTAGGPDIALLLLPARMGSAAQVIVLVLASTLGSTLGSLVLYGLGYRGGEHLLERFGGKRHQWVRKQIDHHGFWAIVVAMLGPPPYPTKLFVLSAGVFHMRWERMTVAVIVGRLPRYALAAFLGWHYGERAIQILKDHYLWIFLGLVALFVLAALVRRVRRRPLA